MGEQARTAEEQARRAGFLSWVTTLVHAHRGGLAALGRKQGLPPEDALDCVQDAFFTFLRLPDADGLAAKTDEAGRLLATLVTHAAQNRRRRNATVLKHAGAEATEVAAELPSAEALMARAELQAHLVRCVDRLNQMQQAVVQLRLVDERPGEEVSTLLGVSPEHVRVLLFRARVRLRECLELSAELDGAAAT